MLRLSVLLVERWAWLVANRRLTKIEHYYCTETGGQSAVRMMAEGYDIRTVRELPGHAAANTTTIHAHVLNGGGREAGSPLDRP